MKVVIFGLGSIGNRHALILKKYYPYELFAFRSGLSRKGNILGIKEIYDWRELNKLKPDIAFITNPTSLHIKTAIKCAKLNMHLFIEKPLSNSLGGISELEKICKMNKLTCYTAYCLRFHPVIKKLKEIISGKKILHVRITCSSYLPDWRKAKEKKDAYSLWANKGGGALLDLSHEFDYTRYLFGQITRIKGVFGRVSKVTVNSEDFSDVLIKTSKGINVNLHINFLSRLKERKIIIDYDGGYIIGDLLNGQVIASQKTKQQQFGIERNDYLKDQIAYFINNLGNALIMNNLEESRQTLNTILELKKYGRENFSYSCR